MTRAIKVFLTGGWGYGNRGDNAILAGTLEGLKVLDRPLELSITSFSPDELQTKHGLTSIPSLHRIMQVNRVLDAWRWMRVGLWRKTGRLGFLPPAVRDQFERMAASDIIVFGGGGYFNDTWHEAYPVRMLEFELARLSGRPYVILGQTVGPFSDDHARHALPKVIDRIALVAYRDLQSKEVLRLAGVPEERTKYTSDMAHLIPVKQMASGPQPGQPVRIGLMLQNFRHHEARDGFQAYGRYKSPQAYEAALLTLIERIVAKLGDVRFVMIPSTTWDEAFMHRLRTAMGTRGIASSPLDLEASPVSSYVEACQSVDVMLSTNMHPVILATLAGVPSVALSYHFKLNDYMERVGRAHACFRIDDFDPESVSDATVEAAQMSGDARRSLVDAVTAVKKDAFDNVIHLKTLLR